MTINRYIESAEKLFKQILEDYFISVYDENKLNSHGLDHHRRVWNYAKEILSLTEAENSIADPHFLPNLIVACYLHDAGMSVDPGIRHGKMGRDLAEEFLHKNHLALNEFSDALETIEHHDKKNYQGRSAAVNLLTLLSVADDLDAFGHTGIYRYLEVYLIRDIKPAVVGHMIRDNAAKRFDHLSASFGVHEGYIEIHRQRYILLDSFFREYNRQVTSYRFGTQYPSGHCGVTELLLGIVEGRRTLTELICAASRNEFDNLINRFFKSLYTELSYHERNQQ